MADGATASAEPRILPERVERALTYWPLLQRLESTAVGAWQPDGTLRVRRSEPAGCILYGPYLHLSAGAYRLRFCCAVGKPRMTDQPVLGVEVIVLSRFQRAWRDFTAAQLHAGDGVLTFEVPPEHSIDSADAGRFEFRFTHFANAALTITAVDLERVFDDAARSSSPRQWRMLGRLRKCWIGRRHRDGTVSVSRSQPAGCLVHGGWPYLRLPGGQYRLSLRAAVGNPLRPQQAVLGIEIFGHSRWNRARFWKQLSRFPPPHGTLQVRRDFAIAEIVSGRVSLEFQVPADMALETGADAPFDLRIHHRGNAALRILDVELVRMAEIERSEAVPAVPNARPPGRRQIVIIGNCQSETLRLGFTHIEALSRRFDAKYHFVQLQQNQRDFVARDLERCDILLVQDVRDWDSFPLRDCVSPNTEIIKFPLVRFASLWPFDAWNGPGDRAAYEQEAPNLTFSYLDGLLGRLRREIPDRDTRFGAYRSLEWPGIINYRRLHQMEERRLAATDKQFGIAIGEFILTQFRKQRLFHTTVRPNWQVFHFLLQYVAKTVSVSEPVSLGENVDRMLREPQVPVHPKVARDLGVRWADEKTRYIVHGREVNWEAYVRRYIAHYG